MGRLACGGGGKGKFGVTHENVRGTVKWRLSECESEKCESEKCRVCRVGFSNFCFYSLIRYLLSLILVS